MREQKRSSPGPQTGDVLVSKATAKVEHEVSIVPAQAHRVCPNHDAAVADAREIAKVRHVDAWLTEDHTHYLKVASYR
jgi:hypothetical protein